MAGNRTYGPVIAERGAAAETIRNTPDMLERFVANGGVPGDLEEMVARCETAKLMRLAFSKAGASSVALTAEALQAMAALEAEHGAVMAVVIAVRRDLAKAGAPETVLAALDKTIANESITILVPASPEETGKKRKVSSSLEARRAEAERDALALIALTEAHEALARRNVGLARLQKLAADAAALSGKLASKKAGKGARKAAAEAEKAAVEELNAAWAATYRILALTARQDPRVKALMQKTSSKR